jgi:glucose-6-phosphate dehydrogenase assembly protein OpcA
MHPYSIEAGVFLRAMIGTNLQCDIVHSAWWKERPEPEALLRRSINIKVTFFK